MGVMRGLNYLKGERRLTAGVSAAAAAAAAAVMTSTNYAILLTADDNNDPSLSFTPHPPLPLSASRANVTRLRDVTDMVDENFARGTRAVRSSRVNSAEVSVARITSGATSQS